MFSIFEISLIKILFNILIAIRIIKIIKKKIFSVLTGFYYFFNFFVLIFVINILSIIPYRLSVTSLTTNLFLSFMVWFRIFYYFTIKNTTYNIRHFLPQRAPVPIIFALVLIETISVLIRPLSLRVRLISNITSGHLVIHLLSEASRLAVLRLVFLTIFEFFVCFIQSYIFYLLINIYIDEIK